MKSIDFKLPTRKLKRFLKKECVSVDSVGYFRDSLFKLLRTRAVLEVSISGIMGAGSSIPIYCLGPSLKEKKEISESFNLGTRSEEITIREIRIKEISQIINTAFFFGPYVEKGVGYFRPFKTETRRDIFWVDPLIFEYPTRNVLSRRFILIQKLPSEELGRCFIDSILMLEIKF